MSDAVRVLPNEVQTVSSTVAHHLEHGTYNPPCLLLIACLVPSIAVPCKQNA